MVCIRSHHAQVSMKGAVLLKTTIEMVPLLNVLTVQHSIHEFLDQNKIIFDDQPAYHKAKDRVADL